MEWARGMFRTTMGKTHIVTNILDVVGPIQVKMNLNRFPSI